MVRIPYPAPLAIESPPELMLETMSRGFTFAGPQSPKSNDLPFEIDQMGMTREKGNWTKFFHNLKGRAMFKASVELSGAPAS